MHHCDWRKLDSMMLNVEIDGARRRIEDLCGRAVTKGDAPVFVEVGEAGIAVDHAMRRELAVQYS